MAKQDDKTAVATVPEITDRIHEISDYQPTAQMTIDAWTGALVGATEIVGADLAKGELLDALVGVPFLITRLEFRKGTKRPGDTFTRSFISSEAVIAPAELLRKRRVNLSALPFDAGSQVVFNDGSTGIYRQLMQFLSGTGMIDLPDTLAEAGSYGETRYDLPPSQWTGAHAGEFGFTTEGDFLTYAVNVRLSCPRGLRISEYTSDFNPDGGKTRYLA